MNLRVQIISTGFTTSLALLSCNTQNTAQHSGTVSENEVRKPNIVYILADDLGYGDVGYNGQQKFETPNIDKLAEQGMVFTQHYSGSTVCAPSRSALMTGLHTGHTPIRGNKEIMPEGQWPLPDSSYTLAEMLKDATYVTGAFGKWGLGYPTSEGDPNNQGFDEFYGYNCQRYGHHYYPDFLRHNQDKIMLKENANGINNVYAPNLIHEQALKFMEKNKDTSFFMFYPTIIPHAELFAPEEYMQKFRGKFLPEKEFKGADYGDEGFRKYAYGSQPESHAAFAAMVTVLDDHVGEIVEKLEQLGIADNTFIIFTSDNGPHIEGGADPDYFDSNAQYKGYKRDLYEGGIHVPMIAYWPGTIEGGTETTHISAFWDVMPTIAEIIGTKSPENIDGISFAPTLLNKEGQKQHEYLYWEFRPLGGRKAVRKGKWKAVRYDILTNPDSPLELYNLEVDPSEENNIANQHPQVVAEMTEIMKNARKESKNFPFEQEN